MDPTLLVYTASAFAAVLTVSTIATFGTWEIYLPSVPNSMSEMGYTQEVFVNRVFDKVGTIQRETAVQFDADFVTSQQLQPITVLASYFGIRDLVRASQQMIGLAPPRLVVELVEQDGTIHWLVRGTHAIKGDRVTTGSVAQDAPMTAVHEVARAAVSFVTPVEGLAYDLITDTTAADYEETVDQASELMLACETSQASACRPASMQFVLTIRGLAHDGLGKPDVALQDLKDANAIHVEDPVITVFMGDVQSAAGDKDAARRSYGRAIEMDPRIGDRFWRFAEGYAEAGRTEKALERFQTASILGAYSEQFLADWGDAYALAGDYQSALEKYQRAEDLDPTDTIFGARIDRMKRELGQAGTGTAE